MLVTVSTSPAYFNAGATPTISAAIALASGTSFANGSLDLSIHDGSTLLVFATEKVGALRAGQQLVHQFKTTWTAPSPGGNPITIVAVLREHNDANIGGHAYSGVLRLIYHCEQAKAGTDAKTARVKCHYMTPARRVINAVATTVKPKKRPLP